MERERERRIKHLAFIEYVTLNTLTGYTCRDVHVHVKVFVLLTQNSLRLSSISLVEGAVMISVNSDFMRPQNTSG